jgi:8-oxo-dGTP pyrophosphatase MutT (NUDIX family)
MEHYPAARVLLLDAADRVLLLRWIDPARGLVWVTPGGRIDAGESPEQAARRELHEEVGIAGVELGRILARLRVTTPIRIREETIFLARWTGEPVLGHLPDPGTEGWHWFSLAEIEGSNERFHPWNVGELLRRAINGETQPLEAEHAIA